MNGNGGDDDHASLASQVSFGGLAFSGTSQSKFYFEGNDCMDDQQRNEHDAGEKPVIANKNDSEKEIPGSRRDSGRASQMEEAIKEAREMDEMLKRMMKKVASKSKRAKNRSHKSIFGDNRTKEFFSQPVGNKNDLIHKETVAERQQREEEEEAALADQLEASLFGQPSTQRNNNLAKKRDAVPPKHQPVQKSPRRAILSSDDDDDDDEDRGELSRKAPRKMYNKARFVKLVDTASSSSKAAKGKFVKPRPAPGASKYDSHKNAIYDARNKLEDRHTLRAAGRLSGKRSAISSSFALKVSSQEFSGDTLNALGVAPHRDENANVLNLGKILVCNAAPQKGGPDKQFAQSGTLGDTHFQHVVSLSSDDDMELAKHHSASKEHFSGTHEKSTSAHVQKKQVPPLDASSQPGKGAHPALGSSNTSIHKSSPTLQSHGGLFDSGAWGAICDYAKLPRRPRVSCIERILSHQLGSGSKVPRLAVVVAKIQFLEDGAMVLLADPSGEIESEMHSDVLKIPGVAEGAALLLKDFTVFRPHLNREGYASHSIIIVPRNVVKVMPARGPDPESPIIADKRDLMSIYEGQTSEPDPAPQESIKDLLDYSSGPDDHNQNQKSSPRDEPPRDEKIPCPNADVPCPAIIPLYSQSQSAQAPNASANPFTLSTKSVVAAPVQELGQTPNSVEDLNTQPSTDFFTTTKATAGEAPGVSNPSTNNNTQTSAFNDGGWLEDEQEHDF